MHYQDVWWMYPRKANEREARGYLPGIEQAYHESGCLVLDSWQWVGCKTGRAVRSKR